MEQKRFDQIVAALKSKPQLDRPCPRCQSREFELVGETCLALDQRGGSIVIGGPVVPVVVLACKQCGLIIYIAQAALGILHENGGKSNG